MVTEAMGLAALRVLPLALLLPLGLWSRGVVWGALTLGLASLAAPTLGQQTVGVALLSGLWTGALLGIAATAPVWAARLLGELVGATAGWRGPLGQWTGALAWALFGAANGPSHVLRALASTWASPPSAATVAEQFIVQTGALLTAGLEVALPLLVALVGAELTVALVRRGMGLSLPDAVDDPRGAGARFMAVGILAISALYFARELAGQTHTTLTAIDRGGWRSGGSP